MRPIFLSVTCKGIVTDTGFVCEVLLTSLPWFFTQTARLGDLTSHGMG
ncbi:hypothetical protein SLEP1_g52557 [Rubroshorea leprosula]|uniref:Uncharacterized protein n=1 Tax=Rubroshorea leprosula TaxID=152421 RepID=A0AAV5M6T2_9ROSI|nr:hypothetical protein SLEP1_g52557 [Rubroshorea leprosula]